MTNVRTLAEIRESHLKVNIHQVAFTGNELTVRMTVDPAEGERLYTAREVGDLQASEAELVAAPLRTRINALENRLETVGRARREAEEKLAQLPTELDWAAVRAERDAANQRATRMESMRNSALDRIRELERLLAKEVDRADRAEEQVRLYDQDRHSERDRAEQNRAWAERAELRVAQMAEEKREAIERLSDQIGKVSSAVHGYEVSQALQRTYDAWEYQILASAVRHARRVVGSPSLPVTPGGPTPQA